MKRITINIGTHGVQTTAAEMRRRLAQALSKIPGDQIVFFNLTLHLENYRPTTPVGYNCLRNGCTSSVPHFHLTHADDVDHSSLTPTAVYGELARPEND